MYVVERRRSWQGLRLRRPVVVSHSRSTRERPGRRKAAAASRAAGNAEQMKPEETAWAINHGADSSPLCCKDRHSVASTPSQTGGLGGLDATRSTTLRGPSTRDFDEGGGGLERQQQTRRGRKERWLRWITAPELQCWTAAPESRRRLQLQREEERILGLELQPDLAGLTKILPPRSHQSPSEQTPTPIRRRRRPQCDTSASGGLRLSSGINFCMLVASWRVRMAIMPPFGCYPTAGSR